MFTRVAWEGDLARPLMCHTLGEPSGPRRRRTPRRGCPQEQRPDGWVHRCRCQCVPSAIPQLPSDHITDRHPQGSPDVATAPCHPSGCGGCRVIVRGRWSGPPCDLAFGPGLDWLRRSSCAVRRGGAEGRLGGWFATHRGRRELAHRCEAAHVWCSLRGCSSRTRLTACV